MLDLLASKPTNVDGVNMGCKVELFGNHPVLHDGSVPWTWKDVRLMKDGYC